MEHEFSHKDVGHTGCIGGGEGKFSKSVHHAQYKGFSPPRVLPL